MHASTTTQPKPRIGPQIARVRLPDASDQDVEIKRAPSGELHARLIDGHLGAQPFVQLDFSEGVTPRVTWTPGHDVPLATSLEVVAKVCDVLARAASEQGLKPTGLEPLASTDAIEALAIPRKHRAAKVAGLAGVACALLVVPFWRGEAHVLAPVPVAVIQQPAPTPVAPVVSASQAAAAVVHDIPTPSPMPAPVVAARLPTPRVHRGTGLIARSERHAVKGLAPNTGLVALRTSAGIEVAIDGLWVGMTPVHAQALSEGSHVLELRQSAKKKQVLDLEVTPGDQVTLFLRFE